jgi:hypothetical protein
MLKLVISNESGGRLPASASLVQEWRDRDGEVCAFGYADGSRGWLEWPGLTTFGFVEGSEDVLAVPRLPARIATIKDIFHRNATPLILQAFGWEALHASAVLTARGIVGFCGFSESGKSTLAYAMSRLGYRHCSDDALLIDLRGGIEVHPMPFAPRLRPTAREFFGVAHQTAGVAIPRSVERPDTPRARQLSALFVLSRNGAPRPKVTRLAPAEAFRESLTHAYCFNPIDERAKRRIVGNYLAVASQVPVFRLEFSGGLEHLQRMVEAVLQAVNETALAHADH